MLEICTVSPEAPTPDHALARIVFDRPGESAVAADPRIVRVPLTQLSEPADLLILGAGQPVQGEQLGWRYSDDGHHLFGALWLDAAASRDMQAAGERAYQSLMVVLSARGYPHLVRIWNYFDGVTDGEGDDERYRQFCVGRYRVLEAPGFERQLPAATVIGSHRPGYLVYFLASRTPGQQVENPRQLSAFRYPRQYGARSPSFSRANWHRGRLYVSGTAAIVGHETQHPYDAQAQVPEMIENVRSLLRSAEDPEGRAWQPESLKLYVPRGQDPQPTLVAVLAAFGESRSLLVLEGEVCRRDLCVEMEGCWRLC